MNKVIELENWPTPAAGVSDPRVFSDDHHFVLRYMTSDDQIAIIKLPLVTIYQFGAPNDEVLSGHPLYKNGLQQYSVYMVEKSSWIQELERRNSVHPRHDPTRFLKDKVHYIFTFHDSTLECITTINELRKPEISVFSNAEEADKVWQELISV